MAIITLQRIFEIEYVLNFISSPFIKHLIRSIFVHNPLFIYKVQFLLSKTVRSASHCNWSVSKIMMTSYWQVHCDQIFANNLPWRIYRAINMHLIVSTLSFCIQLNTFIRLGIANSFIFVIFLCCYFYEMSQSTFSDQIRPRPLIACLNCAV